MARGAWVVRGADVDGVDAGVVGTADAVLGAGAVVGVPTGAALVPSLKKTVTVEPCVAVTLPAGVVRLTVPSPVPAARTGSTPKP